MPVITLGVSIRRMELRLEATAEQSGAVLHMDSSTSQAFSADHMGESDTSRSE